MSFGMRVKQLRIQRNITQEELAEKIYVSRQTISNWENNKSYPSVDYLISISEELGTSLDKLIKEEATEAFQEENDEEDMQDTIRKNKERIVLERFIFFRFTSAWIGSFLAAYFITANRHLEYLWVAAFLLIQGLLLTFPIEYLKKKYHLKTVDDLKVFFDEKYK